MLRLLEEDIEQVHDLISEVLFHQDETGTEQSQAFQQVEIAWEERSGCRLSQLFQLIDNEIENLLQATAKGQTSSTQAFTNSKAT